MNLNALAGAIIGLGLLVTTVIFGNKLEKKSLRYLVTAVGIIISLSAASYIPSLLGDSNTATSAKAGEYMVYLIFVFYIIKTIFFRKKQTSIKTT